MFLVSLYFGCLKVKAAKRQKSFWRYLRLSAAYAWSDELHVQRRQCVKSGDGVIAVSRTADFLLPLLVIII